VPDELGAERRGAGAAAEVGAVAERGGGKGSPVPVLGRTGGWFGPDTEGSLRTKGNKLGIAVTRRRCGAAASSLRGPAAEAEGFLQGSKAVA